MIVFLEKSEKVLLRLADEAWVWVELADCLDGLDHDGIVDVHFYVNLLSYGSM